jgi:uncharacterized YccA/Bax inhibitor family protein
MQSRNPVFNRSEAFSRRGYAGFNEAPPVAGQQLEEMYNAPAATGVQTGRMTIDDVVVKTGLLFAVLVPLAAVNFYLQNTLLTIGGAIVGFVLVLIVSFTKTIRPPLMLAYAAAEGLFIGGVSALYENRWDGIVPQAVLGTLSVFAVALFLYKSGRVRVTPKGRRIAMIAIGGYLVFSLINLGIMAFTDNNSLRSGPLGIAIGLFAITLAAYFLILDFDFAEQGVKNGLPERYAWMAAFGLVVTLVWLYIEFLRLISILRGD